MGCLDAIGCPGWSLRNSHPLSIPRDPSTFSEGDWRHCYVGARRVQVPSEKAQLDPSAESPGLGRRNLRGAGSTRRQTVVDPWSPSRSFQRGQRGQRFGFSIYTITKDRNLAQLEDM